MILIEKLKYGKSLVTLELNDNLSISHIQSSKVEQSFNESEFCIVRTALKESIFPLSDYINSGDKIAIIVSDYTRPTGSHVYIPLLLDEIMKIGVDKVTIIIALGLHRPPIASELNTILGNINSKISNNIKIIIHNAWEDLVRLDKASFRREAVEADKLIVTGAVGLHPMTGFSGGRKSLMPGIAAANDIYKNHKLYFKESTKHPHVGPAIIHDNPILNDIKERTSDFKNIWALNVVLGEENEIVYAECGNIDKVWDECSKKVMQINTVEFKEYYDIVIASAGGYPSDFSFYQSMKVLTNSSRLCKKMGNLIILSECSNGWEIRKDLFRYFRMNQKRIAEDLSKEFTIDGLALYMALNIIRKYNVWFYSSLPKNEVELAGLYFLNDKLRIQHIIKGSNKIAIMPKGSSILPIKI
jgi:lactate racemase